VRLLFPIWVAGVYQPVTIWVEHIAPEVNETAGAFVGQLHLFESEAYTIEKRIPRYEQNSTVWARHCLEERGLGLGLHFRQLFLSEDEDPTNVGAYRFNLTDEVTPDLDPSYAPECAYFSFPASRQCEWCTLHVFSIVVPITPCDDPCAGRRLVDRRLDNHVLQTVHSQSRHEEGFAVNTYNERVSIQIPPPLPQIAALRTPAQPLSTVEGTGDATGNMTVTSVSCAVGGVVAMVVVVSGGSWLRWRRRHAKPAEVPNDNASCLELGEGTTGEKGEQSTSPNGNMVCFQYGDSTAKEGKQSICGLSSALPIGGEMDFIDGTAIMVQIGTEFDPQDPISQAVAKQPFEVDIACTAEEGTEEITLARFSC
jgi:hypothetical protein